MSPIGRVLVVSSLVLAGFAGACQLGGKDEGKHQDEIEDLLAVYNEIASLRCQVATRVAPC